MFKSIKSEVEGSGSHDDAHGREFHPHYTETEHGRKYHTHNGNASEIPRTMSNSCKRDDFLTSYSFFGIILHIGEAEFFGFWISVVLCGRAADQFSTSIPRTQLTPPYFIRYRGGIWD
jgi:hypothetical protein